MFQIVEKDRIALRLVVDHEVVALVATEIDALDPKLVVVIAVRAARCGLVQQAVHPMSLNVEKARVTFGVERLESSDERRVVFFGRLSRVVKRKVEEAEDRKSTRLNSSH